MESYIYLFLISSLPFTGGVTLEGLKHNIAVGILFIDSWLQGKGHYIYKAAVEDSATAEISRSQVWQWIRHRVRIFSDVRNLFLKYFINKVST